MCNSLGHDYTEFYVCRVCKMTKYDAERLGVECPGPDDTVPLIVQAHRHGADVSLSERK